MMFYTLYKPSNSTCANMYILGTVGKISELVGGFCCLPTLR